MKSMFKYYIKNIQTWPFKVTWFHAEKSLEYLGLHSILLIETFLETC